ncbi:MAG: hypothetical protein ACM3RX_08405 [Methanococcaceae archaeon]
MKLLIKTLTGLFLFIFCIFALESCDKKIVDVQEQKTTVTFSKVNKEVDFYGKYWWKMNLKPELMKINQLIKPKNNLLKTNSAYDEVKILCLDMTKWKDMQEFMNAWQSTKQYSLFDQTLWADERDDWDNILMILRSYTGSYYMYVGEINLKIDGTVARGSISLNPGLNYFFYALRKDSKTIYFGETHSKIQENAENVVDIAIPADYYE